MKNEEYIPLEDNDKAIGQAQDRAGWTNTVLILENKKKTEIFMPCYLRAKLKNIVSLDGQTMKGRLNLVLIFSVYFGQIQSLFPDILEQLENNIVLRFKVQPAIRLEQGFSQYSDSYGNQGSNFITKKVDQKQKLITFSIRRMLTVGISCSIFWSPFEYIEFITTICVESLNVDDLYKNVKIYFNLMNINQEFDKFNVVSYTDEGALGQYDLARSLTDVQFTTKSFYSGQNQSQLKDSKNQSKMQQEEKKPLVSKNKIESIQYGHFVYPVYKRALVTFVNLFLPTMILGFLNLGIFFQSSTNSGKRMMNIAALLISYIAFLPSIREKVPPSNSLVMSEILLFAMACITLCSFSHTIKVRDDPEYDIQWKQDTIFLVALYATLFIIAVFGAISIVYLLCFHSKYNSGKMPKEMKFDRKNWSNKIADAYFTALKQIDVSVKTLSEYEAKKNKKQKNK